MIRWPCGAFTGVVGVSLLATGALVACGSDSSHGTPGDAGTSMSGNTSSGGATGSGGMAGTGAIAGTGARTGLGGGGATGSAGMSGGDGSTCIDRSTLPPPPATGLMVSSSCAAVTPCGGRLAGMKWGLGSVCATDQQIFGSTYTKVKSVCNTAVIGAASASTTGSLAVTDGPGSQLTLSIHATASTTITLPNDCSFCQCTSMEQQLNSAGVNANCSPVCNGGSCTCFVQGTLDLSKTEPVTITNNRLTTPSGLALDYCVSADGLAVADAAGSSGFSTVSFHGPSQEVCDGVDNDLDGVVDNDPADCSSCKSAGVCVGATTAKCNGASGWSCSYTSADYEDSETKCDGLDNDCNGVVDDKPAVDTTCTAVNAQMACVSGQCACPATCHGVCTRLDTDAKNCGACDKPCAVACSAASCTAVKQLSVNGDPCAVLGDGTLRCWGFNGSGELGDGTKTDRHTPNPVLQLSGVKQVAVASQHACALMDDGTVQCWGSDGSGQLGDGAATAHSTPMPVPGLTGVVQITTGFYHTCVMLTGGAIECWGDNQWGELGDGSGKQRDAPVPVTLTGVKTLVAGGTNTCAVMNDGTLQCWGLNSWGQMGTGAAGPTALAPQVVPNLSGVAQVAPSGNHTCVLMTDQTVQCWGVNNYGQLGNDTIDPLYKPTPVPGLTGVKRITVGDEFSCATLNDGSAKCWGHNNYGQLGDNSTTDRHVPTPVTGLATDAQIVGGLGITCALLGVADVNCWGWNGYGQLGDGTTTDRPVPTPVAW